MIKTVDMSLQNKTTLCPHVHGTGACMSTCGWDRYLRVHIPACQHVHGTGTCVSTCAWDRCLRVHMCMGQVPVCPHVHGTGAYVTGACVLAWPTAHPFNLMVSIFVIVVAGELGRY